MSDESTEAIRVYAKRVVDLCAIAVGDALRTIPNPRPDARRWLLVMAFPDGATETVTIEIGGNISNMDLAQKQLAAAIVQLEDSGVERIIRS
jgi:hypothetical protein